MILNVLTTLFTNIPLVYSPLSANLDFPPALFPEQEVQVAVPSVQQHITAIGSVELSVVNSSKPLTSTTFHVSLLTSVLCSSFVLSHRSPSRCYIGGKPAYTVCKILDIWKV